MIKATQTRAARAILNWSQSDLARAADISLATIRKIEIEAISPRDTTVDAIRNALCAAGIEFIDPEGVRRRPSDLYVFEGKSGGKDFFEDLRHCANKSGGEIYIVSPTTAAFAKYCGLLDILKLDLLIDQNNTVEIFCLLTDSTEVPISTPRFQFRTISKNFVNPVPFCSYGNKYALAVPNGEPFSKLIVVDSMNMAKIAKQHFLSLWDKAALIHETSHKQEPLTTGKLRSVF